MYKFIYFNDLHLRGDNPENRVDSYCLSVFDKLEQILALADGRKCNAIVTCGDFWDTPLVSNTLSDKALDLIEGIGIPLYSCFGNHDELNHEVRLSKATSLAHMFRRSKVFKRLETLKINDISIVGIDYEHNIESRLETLLRERSEGLEPSKPKIGIVHALVTPDKFRPDVLHCNAKTLQHDYDLLLTGHYHQPFVVNNIINVGCIGRTEITEMSIRPSVLLVTCDTKVTYEKIELKCKPGEEVFDLKKLELSKAFDSNLDNFINNLSTTEVRGLKFRDLVQLNAPGAGVNQEVIDEIITRIGRYENELHRRIETY